MGAIAPLDKYHEQAAHQSRLRAQMIYRLRIEESLNFREIAERVGITRQWASHLFKKYMEQEIAATRELAGVARDVEVARIDKLWEVHYADATDRSADPEDRARAANVCIRLSERRAKLMGLDSPERHEHTGKDGGPIDMNTTFDLTGLEGDALDKELAGFFNPGYMEGAADGFAAGKKAAKKGGRKRASKGGKAKSSAKVAQPLAGESAAQETQETGDTQKKKPPKPTKATRSSAVVNVATGERARTEQSPLAQAEIDHGKARI